MQQQNQAEMRHIDRLRNTLAYKRKAASSLYCGFDLELNALESEFSILFLQEAIVLWQAVVLKQQSQQRLAAIFS